MIIILETLVGANCVSNKIDSLNMYLKKNYQTTPLNRHSIFTSVWLWDKGGLQPGHQL